MSSKIERPALSILRINGFVILRKSFRFYCGLVVESARLSVKLLNKAVSIKTN
jgi:hypothetical protein